MVLDDIFEAFVIFGEIRIPKFWQEVFKGFVGGCEGRASCACFETVFPATGGDCLGENRKPTILLETLKKVIGRRCENSVD